MSSPRLRIRSIDLFERPVRFVRAFRFGAVTVAAAPQAFVRARIALENGVEATGWTAEMMMPKWFDKDPARSPAETIDGLRLSLVAARDAYLSDARLDTAFGHHCAAAPAQAQACRSAGQPRLTASYGPALVDKAVLDALLRASGADLAQGIAANLPGLDTRLTPDLAGFDLGGFLAGLAPLPQVAVRHTVGLLDTLDEVAELLAREHVGYLKLKLGGDLASDLARLDGIGALLDRRGGRYRLTLDANEQYPDAAALADLAAGIEDRAAIARRLLYIEQPIARERALETDLGDVARRHALLIDESDDGYGAFPAARARGYRGVSSKSCKGLYKSILNRARSLAWGEGYFVSAEDLTAQSGLAIQQDTALVALLGLAHAERNGHHYAPGFPSEAEGERFLSAHPDLYGRTPAGIRLATSPGMLSTRTLFGSPGFGHGPGRADEEPESGSLLPLSIQSDLKELAR